MKQRLLFDHGLGDAAHFVQLLKLYMARGHEFIVSIDPSKRFILDGCGIETEEENDQQEWVHWHDAVDVSSENAGRFWEYNKPAVNISREPLPWIGSPEELWKELIADPYDLRPHIPDEDAAFVRDYLHELPRPLILIHSKGNTNLDEKSIPDHHVMDLYKRLLNATGGTLILLDWDDRVPRLANWRVRHLQDDWEKLDTSRLVALMSTADLLIGVDSGPLHLARYVDLPAIGYFPNAWHYPSRFCLPRGKQVNLTPRNHTHEINRQARHVFNIVECDGDEITPESMARTALQMLSGPRYLKPEQIGADVLLQQFVLDWERGHENGLTQHTDRDQSFDLLLREIGLRFESPIVVETGCIRAVEDWRGAGYGTYLMGVFLWRFGGELISADIDRENCDFAAAVTAPLGCVSIVCQDAVSFLSDFSRRIDVLILDSVDTEEPHSASHALAEIQSSMDKLHMDSLVMFDDTVYSRGNFIGKGELAVPWLLKQGWKILYSGYQTICSRVK